MDADVADLVARIHASSRRQVVLAATGGGASAAGWLLTLPGALRTILEVIVPYAQASLDAWLGGAPASYCSADTARHMARRARDRAAWLAPGEPVAGVACTAGLRSDRPKKGDHRAHVAVASAEGVDTWSLVLAKELRDRPGEEAVVSRIVLNAVALACGIEARVPLNLLPSEEVIAEAEHAGPLGELLAGSVEAVLVEPDGRIHGGRREQAVLVSGSFNPLHHGHCGMAAVASRRLGRPTAFELSVSNPEKGVIDGGELRRRLSQFAAVAPLWLTRAATFAEKARLFPAAVFVVGADTAVRIVQTRFYGDSEVKMREAPAAIRAAGCRFLVAGRADGDGAFVELTGLGIAEEFADLFEAIPATEFRADVSSTRLRSASR